MRTTGEQTVGAAEKVATAWWYRLQAKNLLKEDIHERTFGDVAQRFLAHQDLHNVPPRKQVRNYHDKWNVLKPYLQDVRVRDVDLGFMEQLRERRYAASVGAGKELSPGTIKKDFVFIRLVLKFAVEREKCLEQVPATPAFSQPKWRIVPNPDPYLTLREYKQVIRTAALRMREPGIAAETARVRRELLWFILFCVGGCLRVEEASGLAFQDCRLTPFILSNRKKWVVALSILGKHSPNGRRREDGFGLYGAVSAYRDIVKARPNAPGDARLFVTGQRQRSDEAARLFEACGLRTVMRNGKMVDRTLKCLRPTGICLLLDHGPKNRDYRAISKFARTSPEEISRFYDQTHPETLLDQVVRQSPGVGRTNPAAP